jgi:hypothetical protein
LKTQKIASLEKCSHEEEEKSKEEEESKKVITPINMKGTSPMSPVKEKGDKNTDMKLSINSKIIRETQRQALITNE